MALKALLESLDGLDPAVAAEYVEKDIDGKGKKAFVLQIEGVQTHPDVANLKTALERQKADNKTLKTEKATLEDKIKDLPEEFTIDEWHRLQALDIDENDPEGKAKKKAKDDERLASQKRQFEQQIASLKQQLTDLQGKYDTDIAAKDAARAADRAETQLSTALAKHGVKPGLMKAAKALLLQNVKHEVEDGDLRVFVATDMGEQEIDTYVESWSKSDDGKEFVAPPSGGGAGGTERKGGPSGGGDNPFTAQGWNKTDQAHLLRSDRNKAERLAKSAGFKTLDVALAARSAIGAK